MKFTAVFVGVNVAASIPLAFCQQAMAEGGAELSGTADFLKSSLSKSSDRATAKSMVAGDPTYSTSQRSVRIKRDLTPSETMSNPRAVSARTTMAPINGVTLRPFVAGRKLPTKAELESTMMPMAPQFDQGTDVSNLSGNVSESNYMPPQVGREYPAPQYGDYRPVDQRSANRSRLKEAARVASGYDRRHTTRSLPNQSPSTPGQVGFPCAQQAVSEVLPGRAGTPGDWNMTVADIKASGFSKDMQAEAAKIAASGCPELDPKPNGSAGPAPFPLNLLPEASLKQFIGSTSAAGKGARPAAPSYFGSWKAGNQIAAARPVTHLQPAGFHSNLCGYHGNSQPHTITASAFHSYAPMAMSHHRAMPAHQGEAAHGQISQNVHTSSSVNVATYGPYVSHATF